MDTLKIFSVVLAVFYSTSVNAGPLSWDQGSWDTDTWQSGGNQEYLDTDNNGVLNLNDDDDDGDGLPDTYEIQYGLNSRDASDASLDTDNDGLTNLEELALGTNPTLNDTDGDGVFDGFDSAVFDDSEGTLAFFDDNSDSREDLVYVNAQSNAFIEKPTTSQPAKAVVKPAWLSIDDIGVLPDATGDAVWDVILFGETPAGTPTWRLNNSLNNNASYLHRYPAWLNPVEQGPWTIVKDVNDNARVEIGVIVERASGTQTYVSYDSGTKILLKAFNLPGWFTSTHLYAVTDWNGNGSQEILALGTTPANVSLFLKYDGLTGAGLGQLKFPSWFTARQVTIGSDASGNGSDDLIILGQTSAGANIWLSLDSRNGSIVRTFNYPGWMTPLQIKMVSDPFGDDLNDVISLAQTRGGTWLIRRNDVVTSSIQYQRTLPGWFTPSAIETTNDYNGNGEPDLVIKGNSPSGTEVWFIKDALTAADIATHFPGRQ